MPARQVTGNSQVVVDPATGEPPVPGAPITDEEAVQAAVDMSQDVAPEALFAAPSEPARNILSTTPAPGSVVLDSGKWAVIGENGTTTPYAGEMVEFVARDPGLAIELGDVKVRFDLGRAIVPAPVAARLKNHFLYGTNKFYAADEVAVIGNEIVSYRDHKAFSDSVARMKAGEVIMYATKINPNLVMNFGDFQVRFEDGYASVEPDKVARFDNHMFVREGRVTRLHAV